MMPKSIILDTKQAVARLRETVKTPDLIHWRFFTLQLLEDIVDCARNAKTFHRELRELMSDIDAGKYKKQFKKSDGALAVVVHEVAVTIFEQLKEAGVYLPDGGLPYYYYPVNDPHFNDILLLHTHELPSTL